MNRAIADVLPELNRKPFQKLPGSRKSMFESIDRPALKLLPFRAYRYPEWKKATISFDYHIEVAGHYSGAAHTLIKNGSMCASGKRYPLPSRPVHSHQYSGLAGWQTNGCCSSP